jgi:hypothetical protein
MKWLATFILCLLPFSLHAQEKAPTQEDSLPPGTVILPLATLCSPFEPDMGLYQRFGEIGFVEADAMFYIPGNKTVNGKITIFMKPGFEDNTYTLIFQVGSMYCMISSGKNMVPVESDGDPT